VGWYDPRLKPEAAVALEAILQSAYERLKTSGAAPEGGGVERAKPREKARPECLANVSSSGLGDLSFLLCLAFLDGLYDLIAHGLPKSRQLARVDFGDLSFGKVEFFGLLLFHRASPESAVGPFLAFGAHERVSAA
jgi:hypothetical protein